MSDVRISIFEYDIGPISQYTRFTPVGRVSHLGIGFYYGYNDDRNKEYNFGSAVNGDPVRNVGWPFDFSDYVDGHTDRMAMRIVNIPESIVVDRKSAEIYDTAIAKFKDTLHSRRSIGYSLVPSELQVQANSNSSARFVMKILGIDATKLNYVQNPVGLSVNLEDPRFKFPSARKFVSDAHAEYLDSILPGTIPIPTKRPDCFPPGTPITLADGGTRPIEEIAVGDRVLSFETLPRRAGETLIGGRVVRLFKNITTEFIVLTVRRADESSKELTVTLGHRFFTVDGHFRTIGDLLSEGDGTARVVLEDGSAATATGVHIRYGAATASLFEQAEELVSVVDGALALKPDVLRGWRTYNFEVEDFHTYVAGGIRVHNDSEPGPKYPADPLVRPVDTGVGPKRITGMAPAVRDPAGIDAMAPKIVAPIPTPRPSQPSDIRTTPPAPDGRTDQLAGRRMFDPQPGVQERMEGFGPPTTPMPDVMPQLRQTYAPHPAQGDVSQPMPGLAPQPMPFAPSPYNPAPQPLPDRRAAAENALRQALAERALTAPMPTPSPLQQALMDRMLR